MRTGSGSRMGSEAVISTVLMLVGENSRIVANSAAEKLVEVNRALPPDVFAEPVYNRSKLVNATIATVEKNLVEGALLVIVVLFLLLGNIRAALVTAAVIPITMLMTAAGMNGLGVSGNLMSLGTLDFGLIVDGAVIIVENALRRLAERQEHAGRLLTRSERMEETTLAAQEMVRPTVYGQLIIFLVFVPLLTFQGVEGKTFAPTAITLMVALASAFLLSITFVPAMIALLITGKVSETEVRPIRWFKRKYAPALARAVARPVPFILGGTGIFAAAVLSFGLLGEEFMPQLDEKDITVTNFRVPSASIDQSTQMQLQIENALKTLPEVALVSSKNGNADLGSDPMPPNASDTYVIPKPESEWPAEVKSKADILRRIEARMKPLIGNRTEIQQPIQMRFNELIAGVRSDVAVKLYGDDLDAMTEQAKRIAGVLRAIPGAGDVSAEQTSGAPTFDVKIDRQAVARYGLSVETVANTVSAALGGREAGLLFEGDRRFAVVVRLPDAQRDDLATLGAIPVMLPAAEGQAARAIPLREVARFRYTQGLNQISRENGKRMVVVQVNVRGRDLGGFVQEAQARIRRLDLPPGMYTAWGGTFESLQSARLRLLIVVPICFVAIYALLYLALGGFVPAAIVFSAVPMALAGGVFALLLRGIPFSITAAVGFIALSGVAVLNGLVMMSAIRKHREDGAEEDAAIIGGAMERVRPVLMTALVASLGFVPMALATGTGAEVQRPLATVVIGGLITSTALTLLVLPAITAFLSRATRRGKDARSGEHAVTAVVFPLDRAHRGRHCLLHGVRDLPMRRQAEVSRPNPLRTHHAFDQCPGSRQARPSPWHTACPVYPRCSQRCGVRRRAAPDPGSDPPTVRRTGGLGTPLRACCGRHRLRGWRRDRPWCRGLAAGCRRRRRCARRRDPPLGWCRPTDARFLGAAGGRCCGAHPLGYPRPPQGRSHCLPMADPAVRRSAGAIPVRPRSPCRRRRPANGCCTVRHRGRRRALDP